MMKVIAWGLALVVAIVIGLGTLCIGECADQPLEPWHTVRLSEEFDARMLGDEVQDFDDYLALEDRLFSELRDKVYSKVETGPAYVLARYSNGSAADPATREPEYNRSFEFESVNPKVASCCYTVCRIRPTACMLWAKNCMTRATGLSVSGCRGMARHRAS
jgi:hypothetical protein